jgi:hypothetical protein
MNNEINDGGPAFPTSSTATSITKREDGASILTNYGHAVGMTLRDYFAARALQGLLPVIAKDYDVFFANKVAHACYETADAMLKAREAKP